MHREGGFRGRLPVPNLRIEKTTDQDRFSLAAGAPAPEAVWMRTALHDLAQPLTALECVLFLGTLAPTPSAATLREAIDEALVQCQRMTDGVRAMQEHLRAVQGQATI